MNINGTTVKVMDINEAFRLGLYEKEELQEQKYELEDDGE